MSDLVGNPEDRFSRVEAQLRSLSKTMLRKFLDESGPPGPEKKNFEWFHQIWAKRSSCSFDLDYL